MNIDLSKLALPFESSDIEWRVSRAGMGSRGIWCKVLAYVTARAIQKRLDDVRGPENWCLKEPRILDVNGKSAFACGLSIRIGDEWVTKWDVAEPTPERGQMEGTAAKGGWSSAEKRAGSQWGVARYLHYLGETSAEVSESPVEGSRNWNYATLKGEDGSKTAYYWKTPSLPAWALPKEPETQCRREEIEALFQAIRDKFCPNNANPKERQETITRLVCSVVGEFPLADYTCWTRDALERCQTRIEETTDPNGVSPDVPFEE